MQIQSMLAAFVVMSALLACDSGSTTGTNADVTPPAGETCEQLSERFVTLVGSVDANVPGARDCASDSDCTATTPQLTCQDAGGAVTGQIEACPLSLSRDALQDFVSWLGGHATEYCPTTCLATPSCPTASAKCQAGACTLVEESP